MNLEQPTNGARQPTSILVVDDTAANLRVLAGMLKDRGYKVRPVPSGKLALLAAQRDPPDLILLDINMPEMNGFEVCKHLKADNRLKGIPVIFISSLTEYFDKVKAFTTGGVDYLTRPFQIDELRARVETHLNLRRLQIDLEAYSRHLEFARQRLAEKNQLLEELNSTKNQFLGMAAHDLRNPSGNIAALAELIMDEEMTMSQAEKKEILGLIRSEAQGMLNLLGQLLDVSKIEAGKLELHAELTEIASYVEDIRKRNRLLAEKKKITLTTEVAAELPPVSFDRARIGQVLGNLLSNAFKFSSSNTTVALQVREAREDIEFSVLDQGQGIPPEEILRLFGAFQRGSAKPTGGEDSTGLGLSICKKIMAEHGGQIGIVSEPGRGSRFWFTLPVSRNEGDRMPTHCALAGAR